MTSAIFRPNDTINNTEVKHELADPYNALMRTVAHAIYWKLHAAFLKNERQVATNMLGMLEDEAKYCDLKQEIGAVHHSRYLLIRDSVRSGTFARLYGMGAEPPMNYDGYVKEDLAGDEADFHRNIMTQQGRAKLFECLGIDFWATMLHEVEMGPYGRCDFIVREGRTWHCVEVKMKEAKSSVVSQIDKYRLATELDMCLGLHDRVNAVVVAQTFSPYVAGELSRLSVTMVKHDGSIESLRKISD